MGRLQRRDDGKVVAHLGVVEDAFARLDVVALERGGGMRRQVLHRALGQHLEGLAHHRQVVFGQGARVGTRVGQGLVALVQALRNRQGGLGAVAELAVGLALQRCQVEQQRAGLGRGLALFGHRGGFAAHGVGNRLGLGQRPHAVGLEFGVGLLQVAGGQVGRRLLPARVEPLGVVAAGLGLEAGVDLPVVAADELADLLLALDHHRQRRRLHPSHRGQEEAAVARVERGHGTGAVDAHQPVGLGAATRGVGQRQHLRVAAQVGKTVADRLRRHRLQPQALDRVLAPGCTAGSAGRSARPRARRHRR